MTSTGLPSGNSEPARGHDGVPRRPSRVGLAVLALLVVALAVVLQQKFTGESHAFAEGGTSSPNAATPTSDTARENLWSRPATPEDARLAQAGGEDPFAAPVTSSAPRSQPRSLFDGPEEPAAASPPGQTEAPLTAAEEARAITVRRAVEAGAMPVQGVAPLRRSAELSGGASTTPPLTMPHVSRHPQAPPTRGVQQVAGEQPADGFAFPEPQPLQLTGDSQEPAPTLAKPLPSLSDPVNFQPPAREPEPTPSALPSLEPLPGGVNDAAAAEASAIPSTPARHPVPQLEQAPPTFEPARQQRMNLRDAEFAPAAQAATSTADPVSEEEVYEVQPGDNYWTISRRFYGTARFFAALAEHNKHRIERADRMKPGMYVLVPDVEVLHAQYPALTGGGGQEKSAEEQLPGFFVDENGQPSYRVDKGDTLGDIAQRHLGRTSRWVQVYGMNKDRIPDPNALTIGTVLRLPSDACQVVLAPAEGEIR